MSKLAALQVENVRRPLLHGGPMMLCHRNLRNPGGGLRRTGKVFEYKTYADGLGFLTGDHADAYSRPRRS
jgi:hypothetical protein